MTDETLAGAVASEPAPALDADAAKYDAAFAEEGIAPAPANEGDAKPDGQTKPPLAPEEVEKRWNDTKAALREERRGTRELKQRLADLEARISAPPPQPAASPAQGQGGPLARPDPESDPLGYLKYVEARIDAGDKVVQEQEQQRQQQTAEQRQVQAIINQMNERETDFALDNPDYNDATMHLRTAREQEYQALGYTPEQARAATAQEAFRVTADLLRQGRDPAAAFYELAKARGFKAATGGSASGQQPAPASTALDRVKAGQKAAQTLSGAGGGTTNNDLDVGAITQLKGAAFDKAFDKLREAARAAERRTGI